MNHLEEINGAIEKIESNLLSDLSVAVIADQSGISRWEFQRVFKALTHHSIGDYIRRRRLTLAAERLTQSKDRIIDIAIDYQFNSQEAFTRSFKKLFKMSPGEYRNKKVNLRSQKRIKITVDMLNHLSDDSIAEPEIVQFPKFSLLGIETKIRNHLDPESDFHESLIPFWKNFLELQKSFAKKDSNRFFGLAFTKTYSIEDDDLNYLAAVELEDRELAKKYMSDESSLKYYDFPEMTYAKFTKRGAAKETAFVANYIYSSWLPQSDYQRDEMGNDFEIFDSRYQMGDRSSVSDYFLPIKHRD